MNSRPRSLQVVQEIEIDAPPQRVFRALTDPVEIRKWWSEEGHYRTTTAEIDLRPGGRYRLAGESARLGTFAVTGVYRVIDPPRRLVYTWTPDWQEEASDSIVDISLESAGRGTRVRVVHTGFASAAARDEHAGGWPTVLAMLCSHLRG